MRTLNAEQIAAAACEADNVVVKAGPGSGKTEVLAARANHLIARGLDPAKMVLISYTNQAADEIAKRVGKPFGYVGTFHGFLLKLLRKHGPEARLVASPDVAVVSELQRAEMLAEIQRGMNCKPRQDDLAYALTRNACLFPFEAPFALTDAEATAAEYYRQLAEAGLVDFDAIIDYGAAVLARANVPEFDALLVDEFQDVSKQDAAIYRNIKARAKFFVGDPMQSIFGFRGGSAENLIGFMLDPAFAVRELAANYRCGREICRAANGLAGRGYTRSATGMHARFECKEYPNELAEVAGLAAWFQWVIQEGGTNAVLTRTNRQAVEVVKALADQGVDAFRKRETALPGDWLEAKEFVHYMASPDNDALIMRQLRRTVGQRGAEAAKLHSLQNGKRMADGDRPEFVSDPVHAADAAARQGFSAEAVKVIADTANQLPPAASMADLVLALGQAVFEIATEAQGVEVLTMHAAKGREWDNVALPFWNEGAFPLPKEDTKEAQRLAFVAVTRAKRRVCVSWSLLRRPAPWARKPEAAVPASFVQDLSLGHDEL